MSIDTGIIRHVTEAKHIGHVISEPGDMTRYDYYVACDGDDYHFMAAKGTIKYPRRLNYYIVKDIYDIEDCIEIAEDENCNPWTVLECISCIRVLKG